MSTHAEDSQVPQVGPAPAAAQPSARLGAILLALSILAIAWFFAVLVRDAEASDFTRVDPSLSRVDFGPGWVDPRWAELVSTRLAALDDSIADDPQTRLAIEDALLELPFVAELGGTRVVWPDGVCAAVRLRVPVACVRAGEQFLVVSEEGVVLPGLWSAPPAREQGYLPLLALDEGSRSEVREGGVLTSAAAVDGLSVAAALWRELGPDDWARLARIVIDAREARLATVEIPGTVLLLENGRRVYFGRSPNLDAPGELPIAHKCASLARALRLPESADAPLDWELADVRWDRAEVLPRGGLDDQGRRAPKSH